MIKVAVREMVGKTHLFQVPIAAVSGYREVQDISHTEFPDARVILVSVPKGSK